MLPKHSLLLLAAISLPIFFPLQDAAAADRADFSKMAVERPLKSIISPGQFREYTGLKNAGLMEIAARTGDKRPLSEIHNPVGEPPLSSATPVASQGTQVYGKLAATNPKVSAGLVAWHRNLEAAQRASVRSGKPVMVFQMLGDLDRERC